MSDDARRLKLARAAERLLRRRGPRPGPRTGALPWEADFFGLERLAAWRDAPPERRRAVTADCAAALLAESWLIERSGIHFCARMALASETDDERRIYALIGAEEATHSAWLEPWVAPRDWGADPFNRFIGDLVSSGGPQPLAYLLQVVLEGFGVVHYASLAGACRDPELAALLRRLAQDEALHHAAGLAQFSPARLGAAERRFVAEGAYAFLQMMRSGPQRVAAALARHLGVSGAAVFEALDTQAATATKLGHLRRLMAQPGMESLVDELEQQGAFTPCSAAQCARQARATG